ncbi:hypothetical protein RugamoR64_62270 [Duganella rhizosphaerae]
MSKSKKLFLCPPTGSQVWLTRTVFQGISGIGDEEAGVLIEHACSLAVNCTQRHKQTCLVRRFDADATDY